jgi:hypothetical protein
MIRKIKDKIKIRIYKSYMFQKIICKILDAKHLKLLELKMKLLGL